MKPIAAAELAAMIDHTLLKPDALGSDIDRLCAEALEYRFHSVCVHGSRVARAYARLEETDIKIACVIGFPLGASDSDSKRYEIEVAIDQGASEFDTVLNVGLLKEGEFSKVLRELRDQVEAAEERTLKVILETCLLNQEQILRACELSVEAGAQFVKTSTGFGSAGATVEHVKWMREAVGPKVGVKASGGIRDLPTAIAMLNAGANRLGTSAGVALINALSNPIAG